MNIILLGGPLDGQGLRVKQALPVLHFEYPSSLVAPPKTVETYRQCAVDKTFYEYENSKPYPDLTNKIGEHNDN